MLTLKEAYYLNEGNTAINELERHVGFLEDRSDARRFLYDYSKFLELVDSLATKDIEAGQSPEERAFRQDSSVGRFWLHLLSRVKRELMAGALDWDHLPNERRMAKMVMGALKKNQQRSQDDAAAMQAKLDKPVPADSEEKFAQAMHNGDYGKLD